MTRGFQGVIFTPDDEPYLGKQLLVAFDKAISACLATNRKVAPRTHGASLTDLQKAACQLIPQAVSIALSIRELIRQGYLFGAVNLVRPLMERAAIVMYLDKVPEAMEIWNNGWHDRGKPQAPKLSEMCKLLGIGEDLKHPLSGKELTASLNSVLHAKPDCANWSIIRLEAERFGHAPSKMLDSPDLCDEICALTIPWLVMVHCMDFKLFPEFAGPEK